MLRDADAVRRSTSRVFENDMQMLEDNAECLQCVKERVLDQLTNREHIKILRISTSFVVKDAGSGS